MIDEATRLNAQDFLIAEAALLDHRRFEDWLHFFADDVEYYVPIRVTRKQPEPDVVEEIGYFDENKQSLTLRVKRLGTDVAWAEDPPSFTRRFLSNFRFEAGEDEGSLTVFDYLLLYRSRGDRGVYDLISGERQNLLRREESGKWRIARRHVILDQASLGTKNLGVFL